ncbi:MAG: response regulator transcription factor [Clostridia bacterium]|nr:response regulator transcription factor [Clostridia bacterium]
MRLLLAEDEKELAKALAVILRHNNYSVDVVHNGEDAICYLENGDYDGAILDIMMPKVDGLTVLRRIRDGGNSIPVLILTAKSDIDDRVEGLDAGADDYLTKPFAMKELLARVRAMLRRRTESVDTKLTFGDLTLEISSCMLYCGDSSVRLTNKEFQMLEMLISADGGIISVERFMDKIWGYDSETEQNVVWVYISYLRRKLTGLGSSVEIEAHRNLGYSLEAGK